MQTVRRVPASPLPLNPIGTPGNPLSMEKDLPVPCEVGLLQSRDFDSAPKRAFITSCVCNT